eukprot:Nk52_evm21s152 gene=Nk52_evmTU21s152
MGEKKVLNGRVGKKSKLSGTAKGIQQGLKQQKKEQYNNGSKKNESIAQSQKQKQHKKTAAGRLSRTDVIKAMLLKKQNQMNNTGGAKKENEANLNSKSTEIIERNKGGSHEKQKELITIGKSKSKSKSSSDVFGKMQKKLDGARFRWINEQLYTMAGGAALDMFREDESLFDVYHYGYREQVKRWPQNPVDVMISFVRDNMVPAEKRVVVDFGCGDGKLARSVANPVHSVDLVKCKFELPAEVVDSVRKGDGEEDRKFNDSLLSPHFVNTDNYYRTVACNMAKSPLPASSAHMAVFSLSLMGTDFLSFVHEANRVLKNNAGVMKIAEVNSRIENMDAFISAIEAVGFTLLDKDESNDVFIDFTFRKCRDYSSRYGQQEKKNKKNKKKNSGGAGENFKESKLLKPCLYKKR